jgi:hypothetical protein
MGNLNNQLRRLHQRLGAREELIAGIVLAVLAVGGLAFTVTTNVGTPAGAALAYMAAVDRADTSYVWGHSIIDSSKVSKADVALLDRTALAAQLAATAHSRSSFKVQGVSFDNGGTKVMLTYNTSVGRRAASLFLRGGAPHAWPVAVEPASLGIAIPAGAGGLAIDGQPVATAGVELKLAVFPGTHKITLGASPLYQAYMGEVDAETPLPGLSPVSLAKVQMTEDGSNEAKQAVTKAFQACVQSTSLTTSGCPQSLPELDVADGAVRWTLLGDPVADSTVGLDDKSVLEVRGHFVMKLSYGSQRLHRDRLLGVGAPYIAALSWDGQGLKLSGFQDASSVADLARPAATDTQVLGALRAQFNSCLGIQAGELPGCPQSVIAIDGSNFTWHEDSDSMQGASLTWDGKRSIFAVSGNFAFSVDYDSTPPYSPTRHIHDTSSGPYTANLYWDGSKVLFIGLEK